MSTKQFSNYEDLLTFTRASGGHALRPVSYGAELVTNGDDFSSGWSSTGWTFSSGQASVTGNGTNQNLYGTPTSNAVVGKLYQLSYEVITSSVVNGSFRAGAYSGASFFGGSFLSLPVSVGTHKVNFIGAPSGAGSVLDFWLSSSAASGTLTIDNISLKEVTFDQPDGTLTLFEHPVNVPRVEWDSAGNRLGLLVEEARTNLLPYSEDFSQWDGITSSRASIQADTVLAPNGILSADTLSDADTSTGNHNLFEYITLTTGVVYTLSFYAKAGTSDYINFYLDSSFATFQFSTETLSQSGAVNATYESVGNGWYRLTYKYTATGTSRPVSLWTGAGSSTNTSYAGDPTKTVYIYGAQVEAGSFPTSYIKTEGATATRSADVASVPVADFGFNADAGSFVLDASWAGNAIDVSTIVHLGYGTDRHLVYYNGSGYRYQVKSGNIITAQITASGAEENDVIAASYKKDSYFLVDGSGVVSDTSGNLPATVLTTLDIGGYSSDNHFNGHIKSIRYFPRQLTSAQLQELTS